MRRLLCSALVLVVLPRAGTLQVVHAVAGSSAGSSRGAPPRMMAGKLLRVSHSITDAQASSFYVSGLASRRCLRMDQDAWLAKAVSCSSLMRSQMAATSPMAARGLNLAVLAAVAAAVAEAERS